MRQIISLLATGAVLAVGVTTSSASLSSGPFTTSTPIPSTLTDWAGSIVFPQFNSALGTLESVTLSFTSSASTTWGVSNAVGAGMASHLSAYTGLQMSIEDSGNNFLGNDPEYTLNTPTYTPANLVGGATATSGLNTVTGGSTNIYTAAPILGEFTGAGTISLDASTFTQTFESSHNGNVTWTQNSYAGLTGVILYTYTPVPEPTTMVAGALMLLPFGTSALRKLRKKA